MFKIYKGRFESKEKLEEAILVYNKQMEIYLKPTFGIPRPTAHKDVINTIKVGIQNIEWIDKTEKEYLKEERIKNKPIETFKNANSLEEAKEIKKDLLLTERNYYLDQLRYKYEDQEITLGKLFQKRKKLKDYDKSVEWNSITNIDELYSFNLKNLYESIISS